MPKNKERNAEEALRGEIKSLRKLVKNLRKQLDRALNRKTHKEAVEIEASRDERDKCPECGEPMKDPLNLGIKTVSFCSSCDYRKTENTK